MISTTSTSESLAVDRPLLPWVFHDPEGRAWLEEKLLPAWLPTRRWFGGKARAITRVVVEIAIPWADRNAHVMVVRVESAGTAPERYAIPLACTAAEDFDNGAEILARGAGTDVLSEAIYIPPFRAELLSLMASASSIGSGTSHLHGEGGHFLASRWEDVAKQSRVLDAEQSNTSMLFGDRLFLKLFRRMQPGISPDAEISRFLGERGFPHVPPFAGALEIRSASGESTPFGLLLGCVPNHGDAWAWALGAWRDGRESDPATFERIAQLGQRTAELHLALASPTEDPAFQPEPLTAADCSELSVSILARLESVAAALAHSSDSLAAEALRAVPAARRRIESLAALPSSVVKTRHHGDYHLGQVLNTGSDWIIIDFEGEPMRPLAERRAKRSPLRDVAGMLRSFHYAAHASHTAIDEASLTRAEAWSDSARSAFLDRYLSVATGAIFLPAAPADRNALLDAFTIEKALYEIDYELNNRPTWLPIPLRGFLTVMHHSPTGALNL